VDAREARIEAERQALRVLCQAALTGPAQASALSLLATYDFQVPVHRIVFEIVSTFPPANAATIREQLGPRLTNKGFPDFDFCALFAPHGLTPAEALLLIERLASGAL
jgi:hypothetical protein